MRRWRTEKRSFCFHNLTLGSELPQESLLAMSEALSWLIREGLLVQQPGHQAGWFVPSRRAQGIHTKSDVESYIKAKQLPRAQLHASIIQQAYSDFMRGDYSGAVFKAFREVEIVVRESAKFADTDIGVPLMRKAFDPKSGVLSDPAQHEGSTISFICRRDRFL